MVGPLDKLPGIGKLSVPDVWEDECLFIAELFKGYADTLESLEEVVVNKVSSSSMFYVPILFGKVKLRAVVDAAAEVTIVSDKFLSLLDPAPPILQTVILKTAGRGQRMTSMRIGLVPIKLGQSWFEEVVYCAPLEDDMLLGLDFLQKYGIDISITQPKLIVGGEEVHMYYGMDSKVACIQRVCIARRAVVPPFSVRQARCKVVGDPGLQGSDLFLFQPTHRLPFWIPRIVFDRGKYVYIYVFWFAFVYTV